MLASNRAADLLSRCLASMQDRNALVHFRVRARNYVRGNDLTYASGRCGAGIDCAAHGGNFAADNGRHQTGVNLFIADEMNVGGFYHCIRCLDHRD